MEGHAERAGRGDQRSASGFVDITFRIERADHHAVATESHADFDVAEHHFELGCIVAEVARARADQSVEWDAQSVARDGYRAVRRRGAALAQVVAQLYTVRAALLRGERRAQRVGGDLEDG